MRSCKHGDNWPLEIFFNIQFTQKPDSSILGIYCTLLARDSGPIRKRSMQRGVSSWTFSLVFQALKCAEHHASPFANLLDYGRQNARELDERKRLHTYCGSPSDTVIFAMGMRVLIWVMFLSECGFWTFCSLRMNDGVCRLLPRNFLRYQVSVFHDRHLLIILEAHPRLRGNPSIYHVHLIHDIIGRERCPRRILGCSALNTVCFVSHRFTAISDS